MMIVYLDWAASAIPDDEIIASVLETNRLFFGNPSSRHTPGQQAMESIIRDRETIAASIGCSPEHLIFTSGGTESNNMILQSSLSKNRRNGLVCSSIEHASIYETAQWVSQRGIPVTFAGNGPDGFTDPGKVYDAIDLNTGIVTVMTVNNETGAVQPIEKIIKAVREREAEFGFPIHFHTDAVQALGKIPFNPVSLDVDSASFSAHKLGGPKGIGALYVRKDLQPLIIGGGQETGFRAGTENTAGIRGFALAVEKRMKNMNDELPRAELLRKKLIDSIQSMKIGALFCSGDGQFSPYISTWFFPPVPGEVLARVLNDRGYAVSTGSACSSRKKKKTRVLESMGVEPLHAASALRISIGHSTTETELDSFCKILGEEVGRLRKVTG